MIEHLYEDLSVHLYEGEPITKKAPTPPPITYLTQWKIVGNSEVHTDEYLTQWKLSGNSQIQQYLTQWKIEGNSVVDNNAILSCGDLGQDGKYHVKISNGVDVFDIALIEPLRMVNDVADKIEFANGVATLTRKIASVKWNDCNVTYQAEREYKRFLTTSIASLINHPTDSFERVQMCLSSDFIQNNAPLQSSVETNPTDLCMAVYIDGIVYIRDTSTTSVEDFYEKYGTHEFLYRLETPTTETIQAPQISVSPTNTYSSANTTPYSAFTYANPLIYSCGDYSDVDGKYHVKISNGVTIYDIPLTEPLRKVGSVADSIEFVNGSAVLTRKIGRTTLDSFIWTYFASTNRWGCNTPGIKRASTWRDVANILCTIYNTVSDKESSEGVTGICMLAAERIMIYDSNYIHSSDQTDFEAHIANVELIYEKSTPATEIIQAPQIAVSPTDTYTSANDTPYSAFEYKKNVEIWSCGEYSAVDGKWHIRILPEGYGVVDIALDEPLRKVNYVADTIEFADGVATLTRNFGSVDMFILPWTIQTNGLFRSMSNDYVNSMKYLTRNLLNIRYTAVVGTLTSDLSIAVTNSQAMPILRVKDTNYTDVDTFKNSLQGVELVYELATPTTEVVQVPQIQEAESYSCVISQGGKAVEWSSFITDND